MVAYDRMTAYGLTHQPLRSGLPTEEQLVIELLKIRAAVPESRSGPDAISWARDAVKELSLRHMFGWTTPFGNVELVSDSLEALNWMKRELEKDHADRAP